MRSFKNTYVNTIVRCDKCGYLSPMLICWDNNKTYKIDKVLRCTAGGGKWFVEGK